MTSWSRKLVLVLALAVMPLQGLAATLSILLCHGDAQAHAMHAPSPDNDHDHGSGQNAHHGAQNDDGGSAVYHPCCNVTVSVPSTLTVPSVSPDFRVRAFAPDSLHDLFIPDRPQRPPLA